MRRMSEQDDPSTLAYTNLQPEQIIAALEDLGYRCDGRFLALNSYENRVYQIGIEDDSPVVAKFYRPGRWSDAQILEEHSFAVELADGDLPVVAPISHAGETLLKSSNFRFAVYESRGGRAPELDNYDLQRQLGRFIARIHLIGETRPFKTRPSVDIESYGIASCEYLLDHEFIPYELEDALNIELGQEHAVEHPILLIDELARDFRDMSELFRRSHVVRPALGRAIRRLLLQPGDPNLEKLIENQAGDAQKPEPFQQWHVFILGLGQHPPVEFQQ